MADLHKGKGNAGKAAEGRETAQAGGRKVAEKAGEASEVTTGAAAIGAASRVRLKSTLKS